MQKIEIIIEKLIKIHKKCISEGLVDHAKNELNLAGLFDKDADYGGLIGKSVMELIKTMSGQGHSGFSAQMVRELFNKLSNYETLTPITSNPNEWVDVAGYGCGDVKETLWQSTRNPSTFSKDGGKTWYNLDNKTIKEGIKIGLSKYKQILLENKENNKYKIYCDVDGVLVDFDKGYYDLTGTKASLETPPDQFWEPISKAGSDFWANLEWMSEGKQLWDYIKKYKPKLLSAPSRENSSRIGKREWVKNNIPEAKLILAAAELKQHYASPKSILIDDREKNINEWVEAGGIGILHTSTSDTIKQLKELGI